VGVTGGGGQVVVGGRKTYARDDPDCQVPSSSLLLSSLELSDAKVYEPSIRARLGTAAHFCEVVCQVPAHPTVSVVG